MRAKVDQEYPAVLGANIRRWRTSKGMTQEQLADRASVSAKYLSRIELGRQDPRASLVARISEGLEVEVGRLFAPVRQKTDYGSAWAERCARVVEGVAEREQVRLYKIVRLAAGK